MNRAAIALLLGACACQAPRPNVLDELPAPRLMQVSSLAEQGDPVAVGQSSWVRIDWYAGRRRVASMERGVTGDVLVSSSGRVQKANLQVEFGSSRAPAEVPSGLERAAHTLSLAWEQPTRTPGESANSAQNRATLTWNQRQGEVAIELQRRRPKGRSEGTQPFENRGPVVVPLLDYGLGLDFELDGQRTALSEARLSLHLEPGSE